jgi:hypothetical protein
MLKWLHHLLNPHCPDCLAEKLRQQEEFKREQAEDKICDSCETLKYEVERLRADNDKLLARLLEKPEPVIERTVAPEPMAVPPRATLWAVRRQMLEAEDREKAKLLKNTPVASDATQRLEDELLNAEKVREAEGK